MPELLEIVMLLCFGASWPINAVKSYKARTAKGKSIFFLLLIELGYIAGISAKLLNPAFDFAGKWYVLFFYVLNFLMVGVDVAIYFRNRRLDKQAA
ncbi:MAG: hypothetical protein IJB75_08175 [Oscillospiraceae bacterium]|nr:hypothetical protein [Oscillospiraceae bacterium]